MSDTAEEGFARVVGSALSGSSSGVVFSGCDEG